MKQQSINLRQITTIVGLAGIAAIHIMDLPGKFAETPYLAWGYLGIIAACGILIERIATAQRKQDYAAAAFLSVGVLLGFILDRTTGMPGATGDIGNWFEPLGLLSVVVEVWAVVQAVQGMRAFSARRNPMATASI
jgi:hypothetical protein